MGASIIRQAALMAPDRVAGLVLVDGALLFPPQDASGLNAWQKEMNAFVDNFRGPQGESYTVSFIDGMHGAMTPQWAKDEARSRMMATPRDVRVSAMEQFVDPAVWRGGPVTAPTLGVCVRSPQLEPDIEARLRGMFPNLEFTIWDGPGHFFMLYKGQELNSLLRAFVQRHGL